MTDLTEGVRRVMVSNLNAEAAKIEKESEDPRKELETRYGQVWDTSELTEEFSVTGFLAPFVGVIRKSDSQKGSMLFSHSPRFYHSFTPE